MALLESVRLRMMAAELVGPAVVAAKRGDELIGFAKPVVETICAEWL